MYVEKVCVKREPYWLKVKRTNKKIILITYFIIQVGLHAQYYLHKLFAFCSRTLKFSLLSYNTDLFPPQTKFPQSELSTQKFIYYMFITLFYGFYVTLYFYVMIFYMHLQILIVKNVDIWIFLRTSQKSFCSVIYMCYSRRRI